MMNKILDFIYSTNKQERGIVEGPWADSYTDPVLRQQIAQEYQERYCKEPINTPHSHPELFDPLAPPEGWHYDPYYECWVQL